MVVPTGAQVVPIGVVHQVKNDEATRDSEPPVAGLTRQPAPDATARRKSLLHLLLVKEIRAERSALLQCFRHLIAARPA